MSLVTEYVTINVVQRVFVKSIITVIPDSHCYMGDDFTSIHSPVKADTLLRFT